MKLVTSTIDIEVPPKQVWDFVMDHSKLEKWVTIHHSLGEVDEGRPFVGFQLEQVLSLAGAHFRIQWTLVELKAPHSAVWEGTGRAGAQAKISYVVHENPDGTTRFEYENYFKTPGGAFAAFIERLMMHNLAEREVTKSLQKLKALLEKE